MAINPTRGLPSFSEMYAAFKNKGSLGDAINAGVEGYKTGVELKNTTRKTEAEAKYHESLADKAKHDAEAAKDPLIRLDQIIDPKEKADLAQYATPDADGVLKIPTSTYKAITTRAQGAENVDLRHTIAKTGAEKAAADAKAAQDKLALQQSLGPAALAERANASVIAGTPEEGPSPAAKLGGLIASGIGKVNPSLGESLTPASVEQARMRNAALKAQSQTGTGGNGAVVDQAVGIAPSAPAKGPGSQATPIPTYTQEDYIAVPIGAWFVDSTGKPTQKRYK